MNTNDQRLKRQHTFIDFLYWNLVLAVPLLTACVGLVHISVTGLIGYLLLCIILVAAIYRFFCTHCPHYAGSNGKTRCMFFWGIPGFFKPIPGPYGGFEKIVSVAAPIIVLAVPISWLRLQPGLLVIYGLSSAVLFFTIRRGECSRCVNFHCPVNCVPDNERGDNP